MEIILHVGRDLVTETHIHLTPQHVQSTSSSSNRLFASSLSPTPNKPPKMGQERIVMDVVALNGKEKTSMDIVALGKEKTSMNIVALGKEKTSMNIVALGKEKTSMNIVALGKEKTSMNIVVV
ncbi:hypothetical protein M8J77_000848 [Diaphorina citri]|nr:hypothetical protein M8J77_000848 [Diaphorina citri]